LRFPDKPALVFMDAVLTYAQVLRWADALAVPAHGLPAHTCGPADLAVLRV
jgi:hypothetical protein